MKKLKSRSTLKLQILTTLAIPIDNQFSVPHVFLDKVEDAMAEVARRKLVLCLAGPTKMLTSIYPDQKGLLFIANVCPTADVLTTVYWPQFMRSEARCGLGYARKPAHAIWWSLVDYIRKNKEVKP